MFRRYDSCWACLHPISSDRWLYRSSPYQFLLAQSSTKHENYVLISSRFSNKETSVPVASSSRTVTHVPLLNFDMEIRPNLSHLILSTIYFDSDFASFKKLRFDQVQRARQGAMAKSSRVLQTLVGNVQILIEGNGLTCYYHTTHEASLSNPIQNHQPRFSVDISHVNIGDERVVLDMAIDWLGFVWECATQKLHV